MKYLSLNIPEYGKIDAPSNIPTGNPESLGRIITWGISLFIGIGVITALGFLIFGGFKWITSGGDKQKVQIARNTIIYSVLGLVIMVLAVATVSFLGQLFGVQFFKF